MDYLTRTRYALRHSIVAEGYCPNALNGPLASRKEAYTFPTQRAAERFLADNPEFAAQFRVVPVAQIKDGRRWITCSVTSLLNGGQP